MTASVERIVQRFLLSKTDEAERVKQLSPRDRVRYDRYIEEGEHALAKRWLDRVAPVRSTEEEAKSKRYDQVDAAVLAAKKRARRLSGKWKGHVPQDIAMYPKYLKEELKKVFPKVDFSRPINTIVGDTRDRFKTRWDETEHLHAHLEKQLKR